MSAAREDEPANGAGQTTTCPRCGHRRSARAPFCPECGWGSVRFQSPLAYTPPRLAQRILSSRAGLEGERKQVTILFADLKDSMELVAARDPEDARKVLDPVLQLMMDAVHHYDGVVSQVMGDGIMAIFGAPLAYEDHALRACHAALAMQDSIRRYSQALVASGGIDIRTRIGLNSGEVVVRTIGNDLRMDYSAVGQTTHLAARMEQLAAPNTILLMAETHRLVVGHVDVRSLGPTQVKGLSAPVEVFELLGVWSARTRWQVRVTQGLTPFVGREAELATLGQASAWAEAGHGQLVAIVGDPGVGKSRLAWEFSQAARERGWLVLETAAMSHGRTTAFRPLADLFRAYFQIDERSDPAIIRDAVAAQLAQVDPGLAPSLPAFLDLMRLPLDDADWRDAEPGQRRTRTLDAIQRLVLQEGRARPLCLVLEDLHWVDSPTQEVLERLIDVLPGAPILVVVTYRPEYRHRWAARDCYAEIHLDAFPRETSEAMLEALLGDDARLGRLKRALVERTEGNPFFLEECVRGLAASNVLTGAPGAYRPTTELADIELPMTVHAVIGARVDRLAAVDKRLLQTAAVIGRQVPAWLLRAVVELPEEVALEGIARLRAAAFLVEMPAFPEPEYAFTHALTQEVAYRSVLLERRRAVHRRILEALEERHGERRREHAELLGHHAVRGEQWEQAVAYLRQAGMRALNRSEYAEAAAFLKEALASADRLPQGADRTTQQIDIRFELRHVLWGRGRLVEGLDHLNQAEPLTAALGDERRRARLLAHKSSNYLVLGDNARALESGREALALASKLKDPGIEIDANLFLGVLYTSLGNYSGALEYLGAITTSLVGDRRRGRFGAFYAVHAETWRVWCFAELGRFDEAAAAASEAMRIADGSPHPHHIVAACWAAGYVDRMRGRIDAAVRALERSHAVCQSGGVSLWHRPTAAMLGLAYAWAGRLAEGLRLLEQSVQPAENNIGVAAWKVALSEGYALAGRVDEAHAVAASGLSLARTRQETGSGAHAARMLGALAALRGALDDGRRHYREALDVANARAMRPLAARCHAGLAAVERAADRPDRAAHHERAALELCQQMGVEARVLDPVELVPST